MQKKDKVYKLFHKSVPESKKYTAQTKSKGFSTREEAEKERDRQYEQGVYKWHSLKIMMLFENKKTHNK